MILRHELYTKDIDGGVEVIRIRDEEVLLELTTAAAEDLSMYLTLSAQAARIKARPENRSDV